MSLNANVSAWAFAGAVVALSVALLAWGRGRAPAVGSQVPLSITVIPQDAVNLDCASNTIFGGARCNFDPYGRLQAEGQPALRPFVSTSRELFLLAGVFEQPEVMQWLTQARYSGSGARVTLNCQATLLGTLGTVGVRWQQGAAFANESNVPVASVRNCKVQR